MHFDNFGLGNCVCSEVGAITVLLCFVLFSAAWPLLPAAPPYRFVVIHYLFGGSSFYRFVIGLITRDRCVIAENMLIHYSLLCFEPWRLQAKLVLTVVMVSLQMV